MCGGGGWSKGGVKEKEEWVIGGVGVKEEEGGAG